MAKPLVLILMGSDSDYPTVKPACDHFEAMGVPYDIKVSSAHRSPERTETLVADAEAMGVKVFICCAGMAAHLGGVVASKTTKPVIGLPIDAGSLGGLDALLATVQMPPGVPVATVAIGKAGATNAAALACQILALSDKKLADKLLREKGKMAAGVEEKDRKLAAARKD